MPASTARAPALPSFFIVDATNATRGATRHQRRHALSSYRCRRITTRAAVFSFNILSSSLSIITSANISANGTIIKRALLRYIFFWFMSTQRRISRTTRRAVRSVTTRITAPAFEPTCNAPHVIRGCAAPFSRARVIAGLLRRRRWHGDIYCCAGAPLPDSREGGSIHRATVRFSHHSRGLTWNRTNITAAGDDAISRAQALIWLHVSPVRCDSTTTS